MITNDKDLEKISFQLQQNKRLSEIEELDDEEEGGNRFIRTSLFEFRVKGQSIMSKYL